MKDKQTYFGRAKKNPAEESEYYTWPEVHDDSNKEMISGWLEEKEVVQQLLHQVQLIDKSIEKQEIRLSSREQKLP